MDKLSGKTNGRPAPPWRGWITIPGDLRPFVKAKLQNPRYAGKLTNYVRELIVDQAEKELTT